MTSYKNIHYIWLGKKPKNKLFYKCVESWKKFLPDWKITEWNEYNLNISKYKYAMQAYERRKYAFVSDVFRFDIINTYHGIYFDIDVEVIAPLNELIETYDAFTGFEPRFNVNPGLILFSKKNNSFCNDMLELYKNLNFYENGAENLKTICDYSTEYLIKNGLKKSTDIQTVNGITIFPKEYFCPLDYLKRGYLDPCKTKTIHHYAGSWLPISTKCKVILKKLLIKIFGEKIIKIYMLRLHLCF